MTNIRFDRSEFKASGPRVTLTSAQLRRFRLMLEAVLNNECDELTFRRAGTGIKAVTKRDWESVTVK